MNYKKCRLKRVIIVIEWHQNSVQNNLYIKSAHDRMLMIGSLKVNWTIAAKKWSTKEIRVYVFIASLLTNLHLAATFRDVVSFGCYFFG